MSSSGASPPGASAPLPATTAALRQSDRPKSRDLRVLATLWGFVRPYRLQVALAAAALIVAAGTVLALGKGLGTLVDEGFASGNAALLDKAVLVLLGVVVLLAGATYARFFLVSWIGERVVADVRRAVFDRVITLSPAYFEINRTGEILSRLTTDTTILQVVVGSSVSVALRNVLLFIGGLALLMITSPKLTGLVLLVVPLVLLPIIFFGRRVRRLSRESQDRIADVGVYPRAPGQRALRGACRAGLRDSGPPHRRPLGHDGGGDRSGFRLHLDHSLGRRPRRPEWPDQCG